MPKANVGFLTRQCLQHNLILENSTKGQRRKDKHKIIALAEGREGRRLYTGIFKRKCEASRDVAASPLGLCTHSRAYTPGCPLLPAHFVAVTHLPRGQFPTLSSLASHPTPQQTFRSPGNTFPHPSTPHPGYFLSTLGFRIGGYPTRSLMQMYSASHSNESFCLQP